MGMVVEEGSSRECSVENEKSSFAPVVDDAYPVEVVETSAGMRSDSMPRRQSLACLLAGTSRVESGMYRTLVRREWSDVVDQTGPAGLIRVLAHLVGSGGRGRVGGGPGHGGN